MNPLSVIGSGGGQAYEAAFKAAGKTQEPGDKGAGFSTAIKNAVGETNRLQTEADEMVTKLGTGEIGDVHQVMLAMNRADLSFRMMLEVRNKLLDAYQEVMRMQV